MTTNTDWACPTCGADNTPEHCAGVADEDRQLLYPDWPARCEPGVVCTCTCEDCRPQTCRECGDDLW